MGDIIKPDFSTEKPAKPATARCTGPVPSGVKLDGLRRTTGKPDTLPADLAPMGLDPRSWPFTEGSERVGKRTLRELRDWVADVLATSAETERAILEAAAFLERAARMNTIVRGECQRIVQALAENSGDDGGGTAA